MTTHTPMRLRHEETTASRGIHHLALNTDDMKGTVDFYTQVLGMPLVHALIHEPRHMKSASWSMSATNIVYLHMGHMDLWHGSCGETAPQWLPRSWLFRQRVACSLRPLSSKP